METKICNRCNKEKSRKEFRKRKNSKSGIQPYCLECQREYDREYWNRTKTRRNKLKRVLDGKLRKRNSKIIIDYLKSHACVDCGENDPVVLEFDHLKNKSENISNLVQRRASVEKIISEIKKCEVRCANCHRRKTAKEFNWYESIK